MNLLTLITSIRLYIYFTVFENWRFCVINQKQVQKLSKPKSSSVRITGDCEILNTCTGKSYAKPRFQSSYILVETCEKTYRACSYGGHTFPMNGLWFAGKRPFGVSLLYMGWDPHYGFQLYQSDPSGNYSGWKATCIGNNSAVSVWAWWYEYEIHSYTFYWCAKLYHQ